MAKYADPCKKCEKRNDCTAFRRCQPGLERYFYRQSQINAYAKKVLPGYYKRLEQRKKDELNCAYRNEYGSCRRYSTLEADYICPGNGDCAGYREAD